MAIVYDTPGLNNWQLLGGSMEAKSLEAVSIRPWI